MDPAVAFCEQDVRVCKRVRCPVQELAFAVQSVISQPVAGSEYSSDATLAQPASRRSMAAYKSV